ncbi:MAG: hypothetical protein NXI31_20400 [bacterium]|nr:hypothetical protein [bacterium]
MEATGVLVKHSFASTGSAFESNQMPVGRYSLYESRSTSTRARVRPHTTR